MRGEGRSGGGSRGRLCECGGSGRSPGPGRERGVGRRPGAKGLEAWQSFCLHLVPGGTARGGPADLIEPLDAGASLGAAVSLLLAASARGQGGSDLEYFCLEYPGHMRRVPAITGRVRYILFSGIHKLCLRVTRGYCGRCPLTTAATLEWGRRSAEGGADAARQGRQEGAPGLLGGAGRWPPDGSRSNDLPVHAQRPSLSTLPEALTVTA